MASLSALCVAAFLAGCADATTPTLTSAADERIVFASDRDGDQDIVLTGIYTGAIIVRIERRHAGFGADSLLAIVRLQLGISGLQVIVS